MLNPIMQKLTGNNNNLLNTILGMRNPQTAFNTLMNNNPQFRQFYEANKNKAPEQIMREYGIDPAAVKQFMR